MLKNKYLIPAIALLAVALLTILGMTFLPSKHEDFFITEVGEYPLKGRSHTITVFMDENQKLNVRTVEPNRKVQWGAGIIDPNKNWLIYVDKINEIWINHEDEVYYKYSLEDRSGTHSVNLYPNAKFKNSTLLEIIPDKFKSKLSESTLKTLSI